MSALGALAVAAAGRVAEADAAPPAAVTGEATGVSLRSARLQATVDPGGEPTTFHFEYGPDASYGFTTPDQAIGPAAGPQAVSAALSGLAFGTGYHYRVVAVNASGQGSGGDRAFRTRDAVLSGPYAVRLKVLLGGPAFGQRAGLVVRRRYRFTARCSQGSCPTLRLRRRGARGVFAARLRRQEGDRYTGVERSRGHCDDGERFGARASLLVYPTSVAGGRARRIGGKLSVRVGGCVHGIEVAEIDGRLVGHG